MPKKPTSIQSLQSRKNGSLGGRPKNTRGIQQARRVRERAIALGRNQTLANLRFWLYIRDDPTAPLDSRMRAAQEIEDRYGVPRQQVNFNVNDELTAEPAKLFEIVQFPAPESWHEEPPEVSEAVVVDEGDEDE